MTEGTGLRADALRNRRRILDVATQAFADKGLSVSVQEIARRAGVGTGTVSRHFPTKEDLFEAILHEGMSALVDSADRLLENRDAGAAFFEFFEQTLTAAGSDRGFAEHRDAFQERISADILCERLGALLRRAQAAGDVRRDVGLPDVEALMVACMARPGSRAPLMDVMRSGLTA